MKKIIFLLFLIPVFGIGQTAFVQAAADSKHGIVHDPKIVVEASSEELICDFYPNLSTGLIHTFCSSNVLSYKLVDENGKTVCTKMPSENNKIRITEVPPGLYVVHIEDIDHNKSSKKITISY